MSLILLVGLFIAFITYQTAKTELEQAGIRELQKIVDGSIAIVKALQQEVEKGNLSIDEAKELARTYINGPLKDPQRNRDLTKSPFTYKTEGYMWAYDDEHLNVMHPFGLEGQDHKNLQTEDGTYLIRDLIRLAKLSDRDKRILRYDWKNPGEADERKQISYVDFYQPWGWTFGIAVYPEEFYGSLPSIQKLIFASLAASLFLSLMILHLMIHRKIQLVKKITKASEEISRGNLMVSEISVQSRDEFGILGSSFNQMVTNLKSLIGQVQHVSQNIVSVSEELNASSEQTKHATGEIAASIQEISTGVERQLSNIKNSSQAATEMAESIKNITKNIQTVTESSVQTVKIADNGSEVASRSENQMKIIFESNDELENIILSLNKKSNEIKRVLSLITSIADQTNLLALNAAVEAARVGEHGKGFAVVANEVRKLAEASRNASEDVNRIVLQIMDETNHTVQAMNRNSLVIREGLTLSDEARAAFQEISQAIDGVSQQMVEISAAIGQISAGSTILVKTTEDARNIAEGFTCFIQNVAASTEEQNASMEEVADVSNALVEMVDDLQCSINNIKLH